MSGDYKLNKIDGLTRADHSSLEESDLCYYFCEYIGGGGRKSYELGECNSMVVNFKKSPSLKKSNPAAYDYKIGAMHKVAELLGRRIDNLFDFTIVPVPSSKVKDEADYDDRLCQILQLCSEKYYNNRLDVRNLVINTKSHDCSHIGERKTFNFLCDVYKIDPNLAMPLPGKIIIFDDVITIGTHFKAMQHVISDFFKKEHGLTPIILGVFFARTVARNAKSFGFKDESQADL